MASRIPAATAEPITPVMLGAVACMIRKSWGSSRAPTIWQIRVESGTAETPVVPIIGLIFCFRNKFINLANAIPAAVARQNDPAPSTKILMKSPRVCRSPVVFNSIFSVAYI